MVRGLGERRGNQRAGGGETELLAGVFIAIGAIDAILGGVDHVLVDAGRRGQGQAEVPAAVDGVFLLLLGRRLAVFLDQAFLAAAEHGGDVGGQEVGRQARGAGGLLAQTGAGGIDAVLAVADVAEDLHHVGSRNLHAGELFDAALAQRRTFDIAAPGATDGLVGEQLHVLRNLVAGHNVDDIERERRAGEKHAVDAADAFRRRPQIGRRGDQRIAQALLDATHDVRRLFADAVGAGIGHADEPLLVALRAVKVLRDEGVLRVAIGGDAGDARALARHVVVRSDLAVAPFVEIDGAIAGLQQRSAGDVGELYRRHRPAGVVRLEDVPQLADRIEIEDFELVVLRLEDAPQRGIERQRSVLDDGLRPGPATLHAAPFDEDTAFGRDAEDFEVIVQGLVHRRHR